MKINLDNNCLNFISLKTNPMEKRESNIIYLFTFFSKMNAIIKNYT